MPEQELTYREFYTCLAVNMLILLCHKMAENRLGL